MLLRYDTYYEHRKSERENMDFQQHSIDIRSTTSADFNKKNK